MFVYFKEPITYTSVSVDDNGLPLDIRAERALNTIREIRTYINTWKQVELLPGASSALRADAKETMALAQIEFAGHWMNVEALLRDPVISQRIVDLEKERLQKSGQEAA